MTKYEFGIRGYLQLYRFAEVPFVGSHTAADSAEKLAVPDERLKFFRIAYLKA
jgi:hypothetical protein